MNFCFYFSKNKLLARDLRTFMRDFDRHKRIATIKILDRLEGESDPFAQAYLEDIKNYYFNGQFDEIKVIVNDLITRIYT
jgi:hypothetical protein